MPGHNAECYHTTARLHEVKRYLIVKKDIEISRTESGESGWPDAKFRERFPALVTWMADDLWDDGSERETSTLMICYGEGLVKVCLNDRAGKRSLWKSGRTVDEAMKALNAALLEGKGDWKKWQGGGKSKKKD